MKGSIFPILLFSVLGFSAYAQVRDSAQQKSGPKFGLSIDLVDLGSDKINLFGEMALSDQRSLEIGLRANPRSFEDRPTYSNYGVSIRHKWFLPMKTGKNTVMDGLYLAGGLSYDRIRQNFGGDYYRQFDLASLNLDVGYQWLIADRFKADVFLRHQFQLSYKNEPLRSIYNSKYLSTRTELGLRVGGVFGKRRNK